MTIEKEHCIQSGCINDNSASEKNPLHVRGNFHGKTSTFYSMPPHRHAWHTTKMTEHC